MKRIIHLVLFVSVFSNSYSQFHERLFGQVGGTIGLDVMYTDGKMRVTKEAFESLNVNYATVIFAGRLNILEFSNDLSLSFAAQPTLSVGRSYNNQGGGGNLNMRIPMVFELNFNSAATVSTRKKTGYSIGGGIQYVQYPLFGNNSVPVGQGSTQFLGMNANWVEGVLVTGVKFVGKHFYARELNLRIAYAQISELGNDHFEGNKDDNRNNIHDFRNVGVMLSFLQYINY